MRPVVLGILFFLPAMALAAAPATFTGDRSVLVSTSSPGNAYVAGASVVVSAPVAGDLTAAAGSLVLASPVTGDAALAAGTITSRADVAGDVRAFGGTIALDRGTIGGDFVALGLSVRDAARAKGSVFVAGGSVELSGGAGGPVRVYGNDVTLSGDFAGDVSVVASGRLTLLASTTIAGALSYRAPGPAAIPDSAHILGGVAYTNASYLPSASTTRAVALASLGVFLLARILGALILAGLLAGLFPALAEAVAERAYASRARRTLLTMLLGFAALVATPILLLLTALTFVGFVLAFFLFVAYTLLAFLAVMYAGIFLGSAIARRFARRETVLWRDGVIGMFVLSLVGLLPVVGLPVVFLLAVFAAGTLLVLFFDFAFPHE